MQNYAFFDRGTTAFFYLCIDKTYSVMTLQQMEYIVALDKYRHFVLAAEACGVTQPTLSAMIQKLEEELDVKIFNRDRKNISPTSIGEKIIRQARITLNESLKIREVVADETDSMNGTLRIGVLPTIAPYIVPDFIYHFSESYPNVKLFIDEKESKALMQDLRFGNIDMAICTQPDDMDNMLSIPVYTEKFVAYFSDKCSKAHEIISSGHLPADHMWILKEGHCASSGTQNFCHNTNVGNRIYEAGSIETLIRIVDKNGGYTIIPELHMNFLSDEQKKNTAYLNMDTPPQRCVSILIKEDFIRERILDAVLETLNAIIPENMIEGRIRRGPVRLK